MLAFIKYYFTLLTLCTSFCSISANAAMISASSVSLSDVQAAITSANSGDVISVPAGTATWSNTLKISKGITLRGAGIGYTNILWGGAGSSNVITYIVSGNSVFDLSGFTIDGNNIALVNGIYIQNTSSTESLQYIRIHHNNITQMKGIAFPINGTVFGLIDNNILSYNNYDFKLLGSHAASWAVPLEWGTAKSLYIENNNMSHEGTVIISSGWGARWVFRHNIISYPPGQMLDAHGDISTARGVVGTEVYNNTFNNGTSHMFMDIRGGTNIVFDNTLNASGSSSGTYMDIREENCQTGFLPHKETYPGYDPIKDTYIFNNNYCKNGINCDRICLTLNQYSCTNMLVEQQDWWADVLPNWSQTHSNYFKTGLSTERSATCSNQAVYWEYDTRKLYRCVGSNNWIFIYTPYTFPHPLAYNGTLSIPNNLKIINE